ncbi:hypothetical protein [Treponema parvum]|nr:hypothetical protein [Treponema parvum]
MFLLSSSIMTAWELLIAHISSVGKACIICSVTFLNGGADT